MADDNPAIVAQAEAAGETLAKVKSEIGKAVFGQERVIELALSAILAGGHALLIGAHQGSPRRDWLKRLARRWVSTMPAFSSHRT